MRAAAFILILFTFLGPIPVSTEEQPYELAWRYVTGGRVVNKAAVDHHGTIYIISDDRTLYALSVQGRERWRYPVGRKLSAGPVVTYDGTVLLGTRSGILMATGPVSYTHLRAHET